MLIKFYDFSIITNTCIIRLKQMGKKLMKSTLKYLLFAIQGLLGPWEQLRVYNNSNDM